MKGTKESRRAINRNTTPVQSLASLGNFTATAAIFLIFFGLSVRPAFSFEALQSGLNAVPERIDFTVKAKPDSHENGCAGQIAGYDHHSTDYGEANAMAPGLRGEKRDKMGLMIGLKMPLGPESIQRSQKVAAADFSALSFWAPKPVEAGNGPAAREARLYNKCKNNAIEAIKGFRWTR